MVSSEFEVWSRDCAHNNNNKIINNKNNNHSLQGYYLILIIILISHVNNSVEILSVWNKDKNCNLVHVNIVTVVSGQR